MTVVQMVLAGFFVLALIAVYYKDGAALFGRFKRVTSKNESAPEVEPSIAVTLVDDILAVTQLRDRLMAEGCSEGVEACTTLLRVIVEYKQPAKGVV